MKKIADTELVLNRKGNIYHLDLKPEEIARNIILVGDQNRVELVSSFFDQLKFKKQNREFITHTGTYQNKTVSVISTGIGTDNIDIVINELDALANIDLKNRTLKDEHKVLNFVRIGTTGALQEEIKVNSAVVTTFAMGLDNLMDFYSYENSDFEKELINNLNEYLTKNTKDYPKYYLFEGSKKLIDKFDDGFHKGITVVAPGFYAPQGRKLRAKELKYPDFIKNLSGFEYKGHKITNFEMETSAIYGLSKILRHNCVTVDLVLANRITKTFSTEYKQHLKAIIRKILNTL